ncbi:hypothetical protein LTR85_002432 [Meristemomyces frigidus]|nr:hypothetical protein LTR85_002432 [Meristemomyces frigidus]
MSGLKAWLTRQAADRLVISAASVFAFGCAATQYHYYSKWERDLRLNQHAENITFNQKAADDSNDTAIQVAHIRAGKEPPPKKTPSSPGSIPAHDRGLW